MESSSPIIFTVKRRDPQLVVPLKPTPREIKKLSNIDDQQGFRFNFPVMFFYKNSPSMRGKDPAGVIREGVAKVLVYYYPLAGRLVEGPERTLMVDCNGEGVLFVEADANIEIEQLGDNMLPPCPYTDELLHDVYGYEGTIGSPLLLIQVTRFICGGFALGIRCNHTMTDGYGIVQFLKAIGEFLKGASTPSVTPIWQREQYFITRSPPRITCTHHEYEQMPPNKSCSNIMGSDKLIRTVVLFTPEDIQALQNHVSPLQNFRQCSRFDLIVACLWKCRTLALNLRNLDEIVRLSVMMDARSLSGLNLPAGYYGNAFAFPAAVTSARNICTSPLSYAIHLIQKAKAQMSEEYVKSVVDLMVIKKRPKFVASWNLIVVNLNRRGFEKIDFGWGDPVYRGIPFATPDFGVYMNLKNSKGEDGVVVSLFLPLLVVERFKFEVKKMIVAPVFSKM